MRKSVFILSAIIATGALSGCATESSHTVEVQKVASYNTQYNGPRSPISVGKFDNRSSYMSGIFSDGVDRLGNQSKTILVTDLQQTGRFNVLDRTNMAEIKEEAGIKGQAQTLKVEIYFMNITHRAWR